MAKNKVKGIRLLTDETEGRRYVQIDLVTLASEPEAVEYYLDGLVAESRRQEPTVSHDSVMRSLKKRADQK